MLVCEDVAVVVVVSVVVGVVETVLVPVLVSVVVVVRVVVWLDVTVVVCEDVAVVVVVGLVVGVVIVHSLKRPSEYAATISFSKLALSSQLVGSTKYLFTKQAKSSSNGSVGPVNSVIALFSAPAVSAHELSSPKTWRSLSAMHTMVPCVNGHPFKTVFKI